MSDNELDVLAPGEEPPLPDEATAQLLDAIMDAETVEEAVMATARLEKGRDMKVAKYNRNHDRLGRFSSGGSGGSTGETHTGTDDDPIPCGQDLDKAVKLLAEDKAITLDQPDEVATLLPKIKDYVLEAKAKGGKVPEFNLCKVSVPGTNLFCAGNKGIARAEMPQLGGKPLPGSKAEKLVKQGKLTLDKKGEVDVKDMFIEHMKSKGYKLSEDDVLPDHLRASQRELDGGKVSGMFDSMQKGTFGPGPIVVSKDNYIVDGHHRWAATAALQQDLAHPTKNQPVQRINTDIGTLLREANAFAKDMGLPQRSMSDVVQKAMSILRKRECLECG